MSEEPQLSETPTEDEPLRLDTGLRFTAGQRRLARLSYRLACASPFAFLVMALCYPQTDPDALPSLPFQILWWILCLSAPVGAILGAVVFFRFCTGTLGARKMGVNYAVAGLVVGGLASVSLLLGTSSLNATRDYNHYGGARSSICLSNVRQMTLGIVMYNQDYDDHYPLPQTWNKALFSYTKNETVLHCPSAPREEKQPATYALNRRLLEITAAAISVPDQTPLLFDSVPGKNLVGGRGLLPNPPRHYKRNTIAFADGHAKQFTAGQLAALFWTPRIKRKPTPPPANDGSKTSAGNAQEAKKRGTTHDKN